MSDQVANAIKVTVLGTYAADAVEITLATGQGAELPDPSGNNYNLPWWDSTNYPDPADDPKLEIVRVTAKAGDVITVTRAQESTGASTKSTSGATYKMVMGVTAKTITDLISETDAVGAGLTFHMSDTSTHGVNEVADVATVSAEIDSDISTHASNGDAHHAEAHSIASHNDTTATGTELEDLTDGSDADTLHAHGANDTHRTSDGSDHTYVDQSVVNGASPAFLGTNITAIPAVNLEFTVIGTPAYHNAQDWFNIIQSAGIIDGFVMSNGREPTELDVSAGKGLIKIIDSDIGGTVSFETSAVENVTLTSNNINYIYVDYNAGTPQIVTTTDRSAIEINRHFILGRVYKNGTTLHILNAGVHVPNLTRTEYERLVERDGFTHSSGVNVTETGVLNLAITAGVWFMSHNRITTDAFDSSDTDTWIYTHYGAASWITDNATATDVDCTHYNDGTDVLASLGSNNYSDQWIYITADSHIYIIYGTINGTLSTATDAIPPTSLPKYVETMGELIAKMIVKQSGEIISIAMVHDVKFTAVGVPNHNDLGGLQGGAANDYYHLTSAEITDLTDAGESTAHYHAADRARANHTGTQIASTISDFDTEVANNSAVSANTSKVTNATHTGEVTGSDALTVDKTAITGKGVATAVGADHVIISDVSDAGNLKKALISDFASAGGDMSAATYDPETIASDVFDMDNMVEGTTTKILTNTERTKLSGIDANADVTGSNPPQTHAMSTHTDEGALSTLSTVDTAQIDDDAVTYAKMQNVVSDERILGRVSGADGVVEELTATQVLAMINVEAAADVTDATNVNAAGAVMNADKDVANGVVGIDGSGDVNIAAEKHIILPLHDDDATPSLAFGDGDTGFFEASDDQLAVTLGGVQKWIWWGQNFGGTTSGASAILNEASSATNPTLVPNADDVDTGLGRAGADMLSLIAGGSEGIRITEIEAAITIVLNGNVSITGTADGRDIATDGTKLDTIDENADVTGSNAPQAHEASHKASGSDEILLDEFGTPTDVTTLNASTSTHGLLKKLDNSATNFLNGQGNWAEPSGGSAAARIWLPAEAAYLSVTNPAGLIEELGATVYAGFSYLTFDDTTSEHAIWRVPMPDYDGGNIVVTSFSKVATTPSGAVTLQYDILTIGLANSEAFDAAETVDTTVNISHSLNTTELLTDIMIASATIDPANVVADDLMVIELSRDVSSDNLSGDGELIGILLEYTKA